MLVKWLVICFLQTIVLVMSMDVSWIPSDPNAASLPLSTSYRNALRSLCALIDKRESKLPSEVEKKRRTIEKMCAKLAADDQVSTPTGDSYIKDKIPKWAFPLCALAGVCYWGYNKHILAKPRAPVTADIGDINRARDARLKRFKES